MFSKLATAASLLLVARGVSAITISTPPTVPQCGELTFDIGEAQGPVFFSVVPGQNPCDQDALFESGEISGGQYKWTAAYPVGTQFFAYVDDESEAEAWSGILTVTEGDDACLTNASPSSSSSTSTRTQLVVDDEEDEVAPPTSRTRNTLPTGGGGVDAPENVAEGVETNGNGALSRASVSITAVLAAGLVAFTL